MRIRCRSTLGNARLWALLGKKTNEAPLRDVEFPTTNPSSPDDPNLKAFDPFVVALVVSRLEETQAPKGYRNCTETSGWRPVRLNSGEYSPLVWLGLQFHARTHASSAIPQKELSR